MNGSYIGGLSGEYEMMGPEHIMPRGRTWYFQANKVYRKPPPFLPLD